MRDSNGGEPCDLCGQARCDCEFEAELDRREQIELSEPEGDLYEAEQAFGLNSPQFKATLEGLRALGHFMRGF